MAPYNYYASTGFADDPPHSSPAVPGSINYCVSVTPTVKKIDPTDLVVTHVELLNAQSYDRQLKVTKKSLAELMPPVVPSAPITPCVVPVSPPKLPCVSAVTVKIHKQARPQIRYEVGASDSVMKELRDAYFDANLSFSMVRTNRAGDWEFFINAEGKDLLCKMANSLKCFYYRKRPY